MKKIFILSALAIASCSSPDQPENKNSIPGLLPVDIYGNFEKNGFETNKSLNSEGNLWNNTKHFPSVDVEINTYSGDINSVESVRVTATAASAEFIESALSTFQFAASLPYEKSEPEIASDWVFRNYNDGADTTIAGVNYSILAPSDAIRIMNISKN